MGNHFLDTLLIQSQPMPDFLPLAFEAGFKGSAIVYGFRWTNSPKSQPVLMQSSPTQSPDGVKIKLPNGQTFLAESLETSLGQLIAKAQLILNDPKLTPENFGATNYFFFVNKSKGMLMDRNIPMGTSLQQLFTNPGHEIELCFVPT